MVLRYRKELQKLSNIASTAMFRSLMVYSLGAIVIGVTVYPFLDFMESETKFPTAEFWSLLVLAYFFER